LNPKVREIFSIIPIDRDGGNIEIMAGEDENEKNTESQSSQSIWAVGHKV
jgi:hypothetical protein